MRRAVSVLSLLAALAATATASADPQDFQLYKLGDPSANANANANFRIFANQLGVALSSYNLEPPESLGHSGFNFAFEYAVAKVNTNASVWPRAGRAEDQTQPPPTDLLLIPTAHIRKGLPFSLEVGSKIAYIQYSRMVAATIEAKWALNEGFFYLPDLGVRGYGTRLIGPRDFNLTTAGLDLGLGKQLAVGGMFTLTPYAGYNIVYTNATSNVIDFDPKRSLANAQTKPTENTGVFSEVFMPQNHSNRFYGGLRFIGYIFELAGEVSYAKTPKDAGDLTVMTYSGKAGFDF